MSKGIEKEERPGPTRNTRGEIWDGADWKTRIAGIVAGFAGELPEPVADMGEPNFKKREIEKLTGKTFESIHGMDFDFDPVPAPPGGWGTIFCLEILEHLYNPLLFLIHLKEALADSGVIYLSTPRRPHFLWTEHHYHEIDDRRIRWLFERAGLTIINEKKYRLYRGLRWHVRGLRPLLRLGSSSRIYKLKKI